MDYYFYNTDAKCFDMVHQNQRINLLIDQGIAVTGGDRIYGEKLGKLSVGDILLMYENKAGIVAFGKVLEPWDQDAKDPIYYTPENGHYQAEEHEYRIRVDWYSDRLDPPINNEEVKQRVYQPKQTLQKIRKDNDRSEVEMMIAEKLSSHDNLLLEEIDESLYELPEGAKRTSIVNAYERNPVARQQCIDHWKWKCQVCEVELKNIYGYAAAGYIHVHHLIPLSQIDTEYRVNPIEDMRPVCPNCHAILHRKDPPYTISELKELIQRTAKNKQKPIASKRLNDKL